MLCGVIPKHVLSIICHGTLSNKSFIFFIKDHKDICQLRWFLGSYLFLPFPFEVTYSIKLFFLSLGVEAYAIFSMPILLP